jgi:hypothetical protein
MATWKADIKTTNTGSVYTVTVEAGASYVAKEEIERLYDPIFIRNLRQVSSGSSSSSSSGDIGGYLTIGAFLFFVWLVVEYWTIALPIGSVILILTIIKWVRNW